MYHVVCGGNSTRMYPDCVNTQHIVCVYVCVGVGVYV